MSQVKSYIHYDPIRTDYTVSDFELESIKNVSSNLWKDVCLVSLSIGLPAILNAISLISKQTTFQLSLEIFLNLIFGILGIVLGLVFGIAWRKTSKSLTNLINTIKNKPKIEIKADMIDVGKLPDQGSTASNSQLPASGT